MAFRNSGGGGNRRNFGGNYGGGGAMGGRMNPWGDNQNSGGGFGGMRQGGGGGQGQAMNAEALTLANNLLNNLLRNQNPPSLLDLPRGGGGGGMGGGRGPRGPVGNRPGGNRNRRVQGGFARGPKTGSNKQGGGIRKQNAFDRAKKLLAKNSNNKTKKDSSPGDNKDKSKESGVKESIYADVPNDMFYCHLCKKHMWDSNSFENHIKGRTHMMMREGIEESYRLKANMIRQEAKIAEQLKLIEMERLKRMGKGKLAHQREYCTMCDLNFHGHLSAHRKSEGHLQLKKFLHPKCLECNKEFPTRIEFDTHLLLPEHLKKASERNTKVGERKKNTLTILTEEDELKDVKQPSKRKKKVEVKKEGEEGKEGEEKKENGDAAATGEGGEEIKKEEGAEGTEAADGEGKDDEEDDPNQTLVEDPENCILDFAEGDEIPVEIEVEARLPKYNWTRPVGTSLISKLECFECAICARFFDTEKTAEIHSRTVYHHRQFVKFINDKASYTKIAQKRAAAALKETERKKMKLEGENAEEGAEKNGDEKANDSELYDPSEATADDEDVEMNETAEEQEVEMVEDEKKDEVVEEADDSKAEEVEDVEIQEDPIKIEEEEKVEEKKVEPPAPVQTTPKAAAAKATPAKSSPSNRGGAQAKATPRGGRGRGRYNRY